MATLTVKTTIPQLIIMLESQESSAGFKAMSSYHAVPRFSRNAFDFPSHREDTVIIKDVPPGPYYLDLIVPYIGDDGLERSTHLVTRESIRFLPHETNITIEFSPIFKVNGTVHTSSPF